MPLGLMGCEPFRLHVGALLPTPQRRQIVGSQFIGVGSPIIKYPNGHGRDTQSITTYCTIMLAQNYSKVNTFVSKAKAPETAAGKALKHWLVI